MALYCYYKKPPKKPGHFLLPAASIGFGLILLAWVGWPILSFQLFYDQSAGVAVSPLAPDFMVHAQTEDKNQPDLTKISNWFKEEQPKNITSSVTAYELSIPKIRINKALVNIGTDDLSKSLIQFSEGGLPGKYGTTIIFGHSVLPQFYDPKNYLTIFSLLPELKIGDDIYVRYDGMDYRYKTIAKNVTDPDDISGLEQRFDNSYLTLVTCVPPGTYFKRLWLTAKQTAFGNP